MQKIDPAFLFELGDQLRKVRTIDSTTSVPMVYVILEQAVSLVQQAVDQSVYNHIFRSPSRIAALALTECMNEFLSEFLSNDDWDNSTLKMHEVARLRSLYGKFETLFIGDLQTSALYLVSPKGGFQIDVLTEAGSLIFSQDLAAKVPDALGDLREATRCIAFELPTAAGFHLHRAHEAVLRVYWDCVTGGEKRPAQQNMGEYLKRLDQSDKGKPSIRSHLRSIKDFHRNPLMHPEQSLESVDQAIDLLSAIRCSIGYMLQEIPSEGGTPLLEAMAAK